MDNLPKKLHLAFAKTECLSEINSPFTLVQNRAHYLIQLCDKQSMTFSYLSLRAKRKQLILSLINVFFSPDRKNQPNAAPWYLTEGAIEYVYSRLIRQSMWMFLWDELYSRNSSHLLMIDEELT